ncbi:MAG: stage II sporulation protein R [Clostridium sp.]|uniref:stage II sporulation protein R n=1 Tax=Clostridium sp. TaxID=1506 RepID=UPI003F2B0825
MKKMIICMLSVIGLVFLAGCEAKNIEGEGITYNYNDVKDKLIRFHVLANSDSKEDQELKMKVKNEVIKYMEPLLKKSESLDMTRELLNENKEKIMGIAKEVIKKEGYDYSVKIEFKRENFPEKVYGNIILPQGEYEAFRILIGEHKGENWWCVMFPPLCFTDVTKGEVSYEETEEKMKETLGEGVAYEEEEEVEYGIKLFEILGDIF